MARDFSPVGKVRGHQAAAINSAQQALEGARLNGVAPVADAVHDQAIHPVVLEVN